MRIMYVVRLSILILRVSRNGDCLNLTNHGNYVEKLKESLMHLSTSVQQMQSDFAKEKTLFRSEIDQLKNETALLKAQISSKTGTMVAFTASLSHDINLAVGQTVIFDRVLLNLGNAYHETYGHFTAPVDGIYQFAVSLLNNGRNAYFTLTKNGNEHLVYIFSRHDFVPATSVIEVQLQARDVVFVKATSDGDLDEGHYCVFSGFLIQHL